MRKRYLDNIRWITVVLVVLYHVIYMFNSVGVQGGIGSFEEVQYQDAFLYVLYPWFMLLLFVVSGMSARFCLQNHTHKEFRKAKNRKLLLPSTVGLLVFWWILGYYNMKIGGAFETMGAVPKPVLYLIMVVSGIGPLWYIQMLWLFSLLLLAFRNIEKGRLDAVCKMVTVPVLLVLTIVIWGASNILNTPVVTVYRFGIYGVGFLLGYLIFAQDEVMDRLAKWWLPLSVLAVLSFMKQWGNFENPFSRWMSKKSWGLYLFHYLPLAVCAEYLYNVHMPVFFIYLCIALAAFGGAFLLYEMISRIPVLRACVCGQNDR